MINDERISPELAEKLETGQHLFHSELNILGHIYYEHIVELEKKLQEIQDASRTDS